MLFTSNAIGMKTKNKDSSSALISRRKIGSAIYQVNYRVKYLLPTLSSSGIGEGETGETEVLIKPGTCRAPVVISGIIEWRP